MTYKVTVSGNYGSSGASISLKSANNAANSAYAANIAAQTAVSSAKVASDSSNSANDVLVSVINTSDSANNTLISVLDTSNATNVFASQVYSAADQSNNILISVLATSDSTNVYSSLAYDRSNNAALSSDLSNVTSKLSYDSSNVAVNAASHAANSESNSFLVLSVVSNTSFNMNVVYAAVSGATANANNSANVATRAAANAVLSATAANGAAVSAFARANNAANSAILSSSYKDVAARAASTALAVTGLYNLSASQRANFVATDICDVSIYDTTKDTDNGAWTRKVKSLSYYNEPLNTTYRGVRQDIPSRMQLFAAITNGLQINDADDPTTPMWMRIIAGTGFGIGSSNFTTAGCVIGGEGMIAITPTGTSTGLYVVDLTTDTIMRFAYSTNVDAGDFKGNIANRNSNLGYSGSTSGISFTAATINALPTNDVDIGVRPTASVAPNRLGLRYPIIAVASTQLAIIDFETRSIYYSTETANAKSVSIRNGRIYWHDGTNYYSCDIPTSTGFRAKAVTYASSSYDVPTLSGTIPSGYCEPVALIRNGGVTFLRENTVDITKSIVCDLTTTYLTSWKGKGCVLSLAESSADVSDLVGGTISDRSGLSNTVNVNGTINRVAVSSGADLVGYTGFSASNYIQVPYSSNFDPGFGDLSITFGLMLGSTGITTAKTIIDRGDVGNLGPSYRIVTDSTGKMTFTVSDGLVSFSVTDTLVPVTSAATLYTCILRRGNSVIEIWRNGTKVAFTPITNALGSLTNTSAVLNIGLDTDGSNPLDTVGALICLPRIMLGVAYEPSDILSMTADASVLYQANVKFLLPSNNILSVTRDVDTNFVYLGTDAGTAIMRGLVQASLQKSTTSTNLLYQSAFLDTSLPLPSKTNTVLGAKGNNCPIVWGNDTSSWTVTENSTTATHSVTYATTTLTAQPYVYAVPVKAGSRGWCALYASQASNNVLMYANTITGATGNVVVTGTPTAVTPLPSANLGNGWWLMQMAFTPSAGNWSPLTYVASANGTNSYAGDNGASGEAISIGKPILMAGNTALTSADYVYPLGISDYHKYINAGAGNYVIGSNSSVEFSTPSVTQREALTRRNFSPAFTPATQLDNINSIVKNMGGSPPLFMYIYDTTKDTDGGAWRKKVSHTTWMNEQLNSTYRGKRAEFPEVALITLNNSSTGIVIYDLTDPTTPVWLSFNTQISQSLISGNASSAFTFIRAMNGYIYLGQGAGIYCLDFIGDNYVSFNTNVNNIGTSGLAKRNGPYNTAFSKFLSASIALTAGKDVALTVAPLTPANPSRCDLPNPTIAVASTNGLLIIRWDGTPIKIGTGTIYNQVSFDGKGNLWTAAAGNFSGWVPPSVYQTVGFTVPDTLSSKFPGNGQILGIRGLGPYRSCLRVNNGISMITVDSSNPDRFLGNYKTNTYETGYYPVNYLRLSLAESLANTSNLTIGGVATDRSMDNLTVNVYGNVSRKIVAQGTDIAGYSGFSENGDYLEVPYYSSLDFSSNDFTVMAWVVSNTAFSKSVTILDRSGPLGSGPYYRIWTDATGKPYASINSGSTTATAGYASSSIPAGPTLLTMVRRNSVNKLELFTNGLMIANASCATVGSLNNNFAGLRIGVTSANTLPCNTASIALVRVANTSLSADQITYIYNQELPLFSQGGKCLLPNNSPTAISYDPENDITLVGTGGGTSILKNLQVVDVKNANVSQVLSSDAVTAVSTLGGNRVILTSQDFYVETPSYPLRGELIRGKPVGTYNPTVGSGTYVTIDATPTVIMNIPIPEGRSGAFEIMVNAVQYGGNTAEQDLFTVQGHVSRNVSGAITSNSTTTILHQVTGTTAATVGVDTTSQTLKLTVTGIVSPYPLVWSWSFEWIDSGLQSTSQGKFNGY